MRTCLLGVALLALPGCLPLGQWDGDLETRELTVTSDSDGIAAVDIDVSDHAAFELTGESSQYLSVERLLDPSGDVVVDWQDWTGRQGLTNAFYVEGKDTVFNWPIRPEDGDLANGTWVLELATVDDGNYYTGDVDIDVVTKLKLDDDWGSGTLNARIVYCAGLDQDAVVVGGVEGAVARWQDVWAPMGLSVSPSYDSYDCSGDLAFPGEDSTHADIAASADGSEVTILVGETIDGSTDYLGVSGGIPGTLSDTVHAVVVTSWLANAGTDGQFDSEDLRLFGETLAHEVSHYMGLYHPVEMTWDWWDALDDTSDCSSATACESALGDNLMFPYPVCDGSGCIPQDQLSDAQQGVDHRYTGTL